LVSRATSAGVPAISNPSMSSTVEKVPDLGLTQVFFAGWLPSLMRPLTLTLLSALSRFLSRLVMGIAPVVTIGRPLALHCSSRYLTILLKVAVGMRPGIQPSQYSAARRTDAGVPPPYQIGIGFFGVGLSSTSLKS